VTSSSTLSKAPIYSLPYLVECVEYAIEMNEFGNGVINEGVKVVEAACLSQNLV